MNGIRRYFLATVSGVALATAASAADLPARAPIYKAPPAVVEAWSWAGPYIGINAGVAWNRTKFEELGDSSTPPESDFFRPGSSFWSPNKAGFTIGGQVGYNWQSGNIVYGLEG